MRDERLARYSWSPTSDICVLDDDDGEFVKHSDVERLITSMMDDYGMLHNRMMANMWALNAMLKKAFEEAALQGRGTLTHDHQQLLFSAISNEEDYLHNSFSLIERAFCNVVK